MFLPAIIDIKAWSALFKGAMDYEAPNLGSTKNQAPNPNYRNSKPRLFAIRFGHLIIGHWCLFEFCDFLL